MAFVWQHAASCRVYATDVCATETDLKKAFTPSTLIQTQQAVMATCPLMADYKSRRTASWCFAASNEHIKLFM